MNVFQEDSPLTGTADTGIAEWLLLFLATYQAIMNGNNNSNQKKTGLLKLISLK